MTFLKALALLQTTTDLKSAAFQIARYIASDRDLSPRDESEGAKVFRWAVHIEKVRLPQTVYDLGKLRSTTGPMYRDGWLLR